VRAFEREFYNGHDSLEAARFYRRDVLDVTGGFDEELTGAEDWDLTIRARRLAPVVRISQWIDHEEGALTYLDACRKKAYYAEGLRRFAIKHGPMALGTRMRRPWMGKPGRLVSPLGLGLIALKAGETIAVTNAIVRKRSGARPVGGAEG
jgi:GT2 family glycosyltransferase